MPKTILHAMGSSALPAGTELDPADVDVDRPGRRRVRKHRARYAQCSNEDPAKSALESERILNVEGGVS